MSLAVTKAEGVIVFTVASDKGSKAPLLCQLLGTLCCSPLCLVSGRHRKLVDGSLASLGVVQIMVGLLTIGLGANLLSLYDGPYFMYYIGAPYWLGASFIFCGIFCIFGEGFSSPCMVFLTGTVNLMSAVLAVVAIVFYAVDEGAMFERDCLVSDRIDSYHSNYYDDYRRPTVNLTDIERLAKDTNLRLCRIYKHSVLPVAIGLKVLLLATAVLQLGISISVMVLTIKGLKKYSKAEQVPEVQQPLMEEVTANPVA